MFSRDRQPVAPKSDLSPAERRERAIAQCMADNNIVLCCLGETSRWVRGRTSDAPKVEQVVELFCEASGGGLRNRYWERYPYAPDELFPCFSTERNPDEDPGETFVIRRPRSENGWEPLQASTPTSNAVEPLHKPVTW